MGFSSQVNQRSHPHCDLLQQLVTNPQPVSHFIRRMPSISVTTNSIISFSGGVSGKQANCDMKGIFFLFPLQLQFSTWSVVVKVVCLGMCLYHGAGMVTFWNSEVMLCQIGTYIYKVPVINNQDVRICIYTTNAQRRKFTSTITSFWKPTPAPNEPWDSLHIGSLDHASSSGHLLGMISGTPI